MQLALSAFRVELLQNADSCEVVVKLLDGEDGEISAVLSALQQFLTERSGGQAKLELNGHTYLMDA